MKCKEVRFDVRFIIKGSRCALWLLLVWLLPLPSFGAEKVEDCLSKTITYLQIDPEMSTDLNLLNDLYKNQFRLVNSPKEEIFASLLTKSQPIAPVLNQIKKAILENHPAIGEFLCAAIADKLLPEVTPNGSLLIKRTLHHILLLDRMVQEMVNDPKYVVALDAFYHEKRKAYGVGGNPLISAIKVFHSTGSVFEVLKQETVDIAFEANIRLRDKPVIDIEDLIKKNISLKANIEEALATDRSHGFPENAKVAHLLNTKRVQSIKIVGDSKVIAQRLEKGWAPLYETWNLAFITGNLSDLQVLYPKLLIPTVIGAKEEDYLFRRVLALWASINFYLFDRYEKKPRVLMPNATELAKRWGSINLDYATKLGFDR